MAKVNPEYTPLDELRASVRSQIQDLLDQRAAIADELKNLKDKKEILDIKLVAKFRKLGLEKVAHDGHYFRKAHGVNVYTSGKKCVEIMIEELDVSIAEAQKIVQRATTETPYDYIDVRPIGGKGE